MDTLHRSAENTDDFVRVMFRFTCYQCRFVAAFDCQNAQCPRCHSGFCFNEMLNGREVPPLPSVRSASQFQRMVAQREMAEAARAQATPPPTMPRPPRHYPSLFINTQGVILNEVQVERLRREQYEAHQVAHQAREAAKTQRPKFDVPTRKAKEIDCAEKCAICFEEVKADDVVTDLENCTHVYHSDCISPWVQTRNNCPQCLQVAFAALVRDDCKS